MRKICKLLQKRHVTRAQHPKRLQSSKPVGGIFAMSPISSMTPTRFRQFSIGSERFASRLGRVCSFPRKSLGAYGRSSRFHRKLTQWHFFLLRAALREQDYDSRLSFSSPRSLFIQNGSQLIGSHCWSSPLKSFLGGSKPPKPQSSRGFRPLCKAWIARPNRRPLKMLWQVCPC
jgi:hypothetical protein